MMPRGKWNSARSGGGRPPGGARLRVADVLLAVAILGLLALVAARLNRVPATVATLAGMPRVVDGDSLDFEGGRVRLEGIDAPEWDQTCSRAGTGYPCGRVAREALSRLIAGRLVSCEGSGRDRYGRLLARCTAGGVDLNRRMVEAGWAVAYGGYDDAEAAAERNGSGLWAGSFEQPREWRRAHDRPAEAPHAGGGALGEWLRRLFRPG
jgi:endonuclease YncB( thermonuclease family)